MRGNGRAATWPAAARKPSMVREASLMTVYRKRVVRARTGRVHFAAHLPSLTTRGQSGC